MTRKELISKHPELAEKKFWAPVSLGTANVYFQGKKVYILDPLSDLHKHLNISEKVIKDIFTDLTKLTSVVDYFRADTKTPFEFYFEESDGTLDSYHISKYEIIKGIEELILSGELNKDDRIAANSAFKTLIPLVSNSVLRERYADKEYTISLDGTEYTIPAQDIISLLLSPKGEYLSTISQDEINGISTDRYLYALSQFVFREGIGESYYLDDEIVKKCQKLNDFRDRDFEAVNKFVSSDNPFLDQITIHPELETAILSDMPKDYSDMEKAIYIYIKMCQTLTYDPTFFILDQKGPLTEKHRKIENTGLITPENNKIVCYDFSALYSKFLAGQNIPHRLYRSFVGKGEEQIYGRGHFKVDFRCGKYLISADSTTGILDSDLTSAKTDWNIHGIDALNQNKSSRIEFKTTLKKVITDMKEQQYGLRPKEIAENNAPVLYEPGLDTFQSAVDEYAAIRPVLDNLPFDARVQIMYEQIEKQGLEGIDAHSYLLQLRKSLFTEEERENNIDITILRHNTGEKDHPVDMVSIITTSENYKDPNAPMSYALYSAGYPPRPLEKEDMEDLMSSETVQYYTYPMKRLPGIFPNDRDEVCARYLGLLED